MRNLKNTLLLAGFTTLLLSACSPLKSRNPGTQDTSMSKNEQTLMLNHKLTIAATDTPHGDLILTKVSVNKITRDTTFDFKQIAPGRQTYQVSLRPTDGDPCIRNMATISKRVAALLNGSVPAFNNNDNEYLCVAIVTALKNDGEVTNFLVNQTGVVCR